MAFTGGLDEASGHVRVGFDGYQSDSVWVEWNVGASSAADFEGSAEAETGGESAVRDDAGFDA